MIVPDPDPDLTFDGGSGDRRPATARRRTRRSTRDRDGGARQRGGGLGRRGGALGTRTPAAPATLAAISGLLLRHGRGRVHGGGARGRVPGPPLHGPDHAAHRCLAAPRRGRPVVARRDRRALVGHAGAPGPVHPVQPDGGPARGERRASSAATGTAAGTSWPTSATSCGPRSRRCARSWSCSRARPGWTRRPAPSSSARRPIQLDRLDWLAQNLLELSKLDSGLVLLELRPDDVRGTIESAVEQQLASAERKGIGLTVALPDRPLRIRHDPPRIGQVVTNLVGNALKFTEPRRRGPGHRAWRSRTAAHGSRWWTRAWASRRPRCP